ncbi:MAG: GGDEF domain-containing protein [Sideroxyarcus sp.]|nr:GGDEF domain-containing protein [Sideroxyarcus sp.]
MTRYTVHRFRAAVLRMYLRMSVLIALPLSLVFMFFIPTPDKGLLPLAFALFALWLNWRMRQDSEEPLRLAGGFVMVIMGLMLYGAYISNARLLQEVWVMIFPIAFAPIVASRERFFWAVTGAVSFASVVLLRPEPLTAASAFVFVSAYLTLCFVTLMLVRHNELNIERLAHLSIIDPLTKVYNRGYLKDTLVSEINRCRRNEQTLTVIMLDIDYFKMLNDSYGHLFGDSVLEQVAGALKHAAQRAGDYVFRYGGEEFCILTSALSRDEAFQFVEKLRLGIYALDIENRGSPHRVVTASAGFWCVSDLSEITPSALLLNADNALYRAKDAGRNAVVDFDDLPVSGVEPVKQAVPA